MRLAARLPLSRGPAAWERVGACAQTLLVLGSLWLVARTFARTDWHAMTHAATRVGPWTSAALLPFAVAMTLDALGIHILIRVLGAAAPFGQLLLLRIATEALHVTMPAGFVVADSATAGWLHASLRIPLSRGAALMLGRKWLVTRAHAAYILLGAVAGSAALMRISGRLAGARYLPWLVATSSVVPLVVSLSLGAALRGGSILARVLAALERIRWCGVAGRLEQWRAAALSLGRHMACLGDANASAWCATASFFGCWLLESVETAVIVTLVGGPFDLALALAVETGVSLLRSIGNVAPAGLGVQDVGYAMLLPAAGLPLETAAAFVLLKRGKDVAWIGVGYAVLGLMGVHRSGRDVIGPASKEPAPMQRIHVTAT